MVGVQNAFVGDRFKNNNGNWAEIVEYNSAKDVTIKFDSGALLKTQLGHLRRGCFKDSMFPTVFGIGFLGDVCPFKEKDVEYRHWYHIFERCYTSRSNECYRGCSVDPIWYNFQNFRLWYKSEIKDKTGEWEIDKDLVVPNNTVYSPENCELLPSQINNILRVGTSKIRHGLNTGVTKYGNKFRATVHGEYLGTFDTNQEAFEAYCKIKNELVKEATEIYKDKLSNRAYEILRNYDFKNYEGVL